MEQKERILFIRQQRGARAPARIFLDTSAVKGRFRKRRRGYEVSERSALRGLRPGTGSATGGHGDEAENRLARRGDNSGGGQRRCEEDFTPRRGIGPPDCAGDRFPRGLGRRGPGNLRRGDGVRGAGHDGVRGARVLDGRGRALEWLSQAHDPELEGDGPPAADKADAGGLLGRRGGSFR